MSSTFQTGFGRNLSVGLLTIAAWMAFAPGRLGAQAQAQAQAAAAPLHLVPTDAIEFVHIRMQDLAKSKAFQLLPPEYQKVLIERFSFGVAPELVETLTLASLRQDGGNLIDLVMGRPLDSSRLRPDLQQWKKADLQQWKKKGPRFEGKERGGPGGAVYPGGPRNEPVAPPEEARLFLILTTREALDSGDLLVMRPDEVFKFKGKTLLRVHGLYFHLLNGRTLIASDQREAVERWFGQAPPTTFKGPLAPALKRAATARPTVTLGWAYPETALDSMAQLAGGAYSHGPGRGLFRTLAPLLKAQPAVLTVDLNDGKVDAELLYADAAAAKKGAAAAGDALVLLRLLGLGILEEAGGLADQVVDQTGIEQAALHKLLLADLGAALRAARVETTGTTVHLAVRLPDGLDGLHKRAKTAAKDLLKDDRLLTTRWTVKSQNNLKQIVIALHAYHDANQRFPPQAICDPDGKPLLSWRVAILPFIEEDGLSREFRLNEAWDSPHNIKLLAKMPKIYAPLGRKTKEPHATFYQGFVGPGAGFELRPRRGAFMNAEGLRIQDFLDGTSNTLLVAEAAEAVPWTKPADMPFDPKGPLPKFGGLFALGFNAAFADGSVRFFARPFEDAVLRALITRNGNEVVEIPD